jgi:N-acetylmuramoyl-L-alanine amidase
MDGREAAFSGIGVWLNAPTKRVNGRWAVAEVDVRKVIDPLFRPSAYLGARTYRTVVLDPGHGGSDRGARGRRGVEEKRAVLDIAKRVRLHLVNEGFKVFLTRDGDRFIELEERTKLAAARGADIFVSIHLNAAPSFRPKGIETFVLTPAGYASTAASSSSRRGLGALAPNRFDHSNTLLGYYIQRGVVERTGSEDRGLRRARFLVLKTAPCPAALVECGFLSNPYEEELLLSSDYRERIAQGIARGILDYANAIKRAQPAPKK